VTAAHCATRSDERREPERLSNRRGATRRLVKGDWVMVPEKTAHWFTQIEGTLVLMSVHLPHAEGNDVVTLNRRTVVGPALAVQNRCRRVIVRLQVGRTSPRQSRRSAARRSARTSIARSAT